MAFFTADQLIAHAIGDYVIQSDWMATEKVKRSLAAAIHVVTYAIPFLFLRPTAAALAVIVATHFVIDRWRLARYVIWASNFLAPVRWRDAHPTPDGGGLAIDGIPLARGAGVFRSDNPPWSRCRATGFDQDRPVWLATWLLIIVDNLMHVTINAAALNFLT